MLKLAVEWWLLTVAPAKTILALSSARQKKKKKVHNFLHDHRTQVTKLAAKAVQAWKSAKGITNIFKLKESRFLFG